MTTLEILDIGIGPTLSLQGTGGLIRRRRRARKGREGLLKFESRLNKFKLPELKELCP
jgi:hypothetical protein